MTFKDTYTRDGRIVDELPDDVEIVSVEQELKRVFIWQPSKRHSGDLDRSDMERPDAEVGECAITNVAPPLLLELLLHHSDIRVPALTALACTATDFSAAVNELWPSMMAKFSESCQNEPTTPLTARQIPVEAFRKTPHPASACRVRALTRPRGEGLNLSFEFEEEGSEWTRQDALMTVYTARYTYRLSTADIRQLQPYTGMYNDKYYRFEDVLGAGMLRFGRRPYLERLLRRPIREHPQIEKRSTGWNHVMRLHQRVAPEVMLDTRTLQAYAEEYMKSGVGINVIRSRLWSHRFFLQQVSQLVPHMNVAEQSRVKHLQKAYVLTNDYELVREATRIMIAITGLH
ncbi:hypothetical protein KFL_004530010 [Klebsormidium nitens]|uniref:Uncharacterized protein n=1 Tax=Klebsormidium nitens TaxID=105231 RepID=A0A1Y1IJ55_KLENI|nr:hypothetical protein KFL_004530010 [Klebsormidium nitens]|eukprot:GAQ88697.1 hypothetical protein KFL_004530010 [Klebsormidium nitens]